MCGIVGWLALTSKHPVASRPLARMRDSMLHRGPDGEGLWIAPDQRIGLAFRRLAIVDLTPEAGQPMANEDGSIQIVFNGEIYNHARLRRELLARGHRFRTDHSDTETLVHGYEEWGPAFLDRLEGMFAIGIWDAARRRLFLARDRIGIKPLYFTWTPSAFLFASEIKALTLHPEVTPDIEPLAVYHYLSFLTTPPPLTMFRGIYKLPAAHRAFVSGDGALTAERYWDALPGRGDDVQELRSLPETERRSFAVRRVRTLFEEAVEKRLMSDVPFGVFLSGGVDSSANVAVMARLMNQPVRTFTVGFADHTHLNELQYARRVSQLFGTEHHEVLVDERAMRDYLPALMHSQDEPIADWVCIPLYFVSKLARDSGTIVVQVGEGSDEQFSGYASYMAHLKMYDAFWRPFAHLPRPLRRAVAWSAGLLGGVTAQRDRYIDILVRAGLDREPFWSGAHTIPEFRKARLIDLARLAPMEAPGALMRSGLLPAGYLQPDSYEIVRDYFGAIDAAAPGSDVLTRMIYAEFRLRLPELLLMRVDKIGMSVSIEPRVPFLDHKLVELTMNLPRSLKVGDGVAKSLLKEALADILPADVLHRPKMGFGAPMVQWLRGDFGRVVESEIEKTRFFERFPARKQALLDMLRLHRSGRRDHSLYVWAFYNAIAWFDRWIDRAA
jgi:asparagine synthase (glutamine-hydrolysing)